MIPALHTAIIKRPLWDKVQLRLVKEKRAPRTKYTEPRHFAGGRAKCASCKRNLVFHDKGATGKYLTCKNLECDHRPGSVKVGELEALVTAYMHQLPITIKPAIAIATEQRRNDLAEVKARSRKIERDLARLSDQREDLALALATGELTPGLTVEDTQAALKKLRERIAKLGQAQLEIAELEVMEPRLEAVRGLVLQIGKLWELSTTTKRVEILEALGIEINISEQTERNQSLSGRVTLRTSLPLDELKAGLGDVGEPVNRKSGPPKRPRLRE
jgi:hypothetical protein